MPAAAPRAGMWRWWSARIGWSRPWAVASRSARPASAPAGWGPSARGLTDERRVPGLPGLGAVDRGRAGRRPRRCRPRAGCLAAGPALVRRPEAAMIGALWLLSLPLRLLAALGLRGNVILACLLVLAVTAYGIAEDLGVVDPPARAAPAPTPAAGPPGPSPAAAADIPAGYLRLYRSAGATYRVSWPVLAAIGKVESDHGRARLSGVRSGLNRYRDARGRLRRCCAGPMQFNLTDGPPSTWQRYGRGNVYDPADAIPAAARKLAADGARRNLDQAIYAYNHSWVYVAKVKALARRYARGGGRR